MPVVTVRSLQPPGAETMDRALDAVVVALAGAIGAEPQAVWAHWVRMEAVRQGRTGRAWAGHCPIVTIRARARGQAQVQAGLRATAHALAAAAGLPLEDIWVHWEELPPEHVFAGGEVR